MPIPKQKEERKYTYQDYLQWPPDERWEIIDGVAYDMSPAPNLKHQIISGCLFTFLYNALEGKTYTPFYAPTDVLLSETDVVQPDVFVVCDPNKLTDAYVNGAPDFIIEILSPSSMTKDHSIKKDLYEKYGVREYVVIDPRWEHAYRYRLNETNQYGDSELFQSNQEIPLFSLPGISLPLGNLFSES